MQLSLKLKLLVRAKTKPASCGFDTFTFYTILLLTRYTYRKIFNKCYSHNGLIRGMNVNNTFRTNLFQIVVPSSWKIKSLVGVLNCLEHWTFEEHI